LPPLPDAIASVDVGGPPVYMPASSGPALRARGGRFLPLVKAGQSRF
jgi:hypothetical protein